MKRLFDFVVATCLLLVFLPVMFLVVILIRINLGKGIFFIQERPGKDGKVFKLLKFRTMKDIRNSSGEFLHDEMRMTKFGSFLRSTSLDELPGLINVIRGDMSLVGPRPLLVQYLELYSPLQARRHEVRPGITGWAQVNGRNAISWEQKFDLDVWYIDNQSFILDIKILLLTAMKVLKRDDISATEHVTIAPFRGNKK